MLADRRARLNLGDNRRRTSGCAHAVFRGGGTIASKAISVFLLMRYGL